MQVSTEAYIRLVPQQSTTEFTWEYEPFDHPQSHLRQNLLSHSSS
jgi:hypothetical protein